MVGKVEKVTPLTASNTIDDDFFQSLMETAAAAGNGAATNASALPYERKQVFPAGILYEKPTFLAAMSNGTVNFFHFCTISVLSINLCSHIYIYK